jgi:signal transduction histidine kinase
VTKPVFKLRTRLIGSHIAIALICIGLISLFSNLFLERQFQNYVTTNIERRHLEIVAHLEVLYRTERNWESRLIETIGMSALEEGLIVRVEDATGARIFDAQATDHMMCELMLAQISMNMRSRYPDWQGAYREVVYPVEVGGEVVGQVIIGYHGPYFYMDSDLKFLRTLNRILLLVGLFSFVFAAVMAMVISKRLTKPIRRVVEVTQRIADGHYDERVSHGQAPSTTLEIKALTNGVDHLARSLEQQATLRKRLTADVAHELRTPLSTLQVHMEGILDGVFEPSETRLSVCHEEILRLQRLVGDLERLARVESESQVLNRTAFDWIDWMRQQVNFYMAEASSKGICLSGPEAEALPVYVKADKDKMSQVLVNLLSNGLKYTPEGGRLEVRWIRENGRPGFIVRDTGEGIESADLPFVFERFYRVDPSRNRASGGAGIGLTICKAIVEAHGGEITVKSGGRGLGTEVRVLLPETSMV